MNYCVMPYPIWWQRMNLTPNLCNCPKMGYIDLALSTDSDMIAMCVLALLCQLDLETRQGQLI